MAMRGQSREAQATTGLQSLEKRAYVHTLSLRLTGEQYRRLRRFVTRGEPPQAPVLRMVEAHAQCMDLAASVRGVACARTRVTAGDAVIDSAH